jgi:Domain of unknown function (DUF4335)
MNSPNQPNRQYTNNSCELSIEDKKSPFPAWMKFNKPNPLKFSLSLADPDRSEQRPTVITGDRAKLESLQQVVGDYVNELVVKAPLPSLQGNGGVGEMSGDLNRDPLRANQGNPTATEQEIGVDRPIDALKLTGDQPHLEADGTSSHLLYLGNLASDGQVMLSLSTLQLFDLSSTLEEGVLSSAPENSLVSEDLGLNSESSAASKPIEPEVIASTAAAGATAAVAAETARQFDPDVVEPRVVLPSVEEAISEDSLITESSIFERDSEARGGDRFKMPKPSLGSLNLPELPDFSNSPLTSIWLWLGLGTVATGIVASPFIGPTFNQLFSSSPKPSVVQTSTDPTAVSSLPPEYSASSQPPTPSGLPSTTTSPSSFGASPSPSMSVSISPSVPAYGGTTTYNPYGTGTGGTTYNPYGTATTPSTSAAQPSTGTGSSATGRGRMGTTPGTGSRGTGDLATRQQQGGRSGGTFRSPSSVLRTTTPRASTGSTTGSDAMTEQARVYTPSTSSGQDFDRLPTTPETAAGSSPSASRRRGNTSPAPSSTDQPVQITGQDTPDLFSNAGGRIDNPVTSAPSDSTPNLDVPSASSGLESAQAQETKKYFQRRWKADPNFQDSLQYNVRVDRNGKVMSINGQTENSRTYLNRTNFLKPGTKVAGANATGQEQDVFVILKPDGSVDTFAQ